MKKASTSSSVKPSAFNNVRSSSGVDAKLIRWMRRKICGESVDSCNERDALWLLFDVVRKNIQVRQNAVQTNAPCKPNSSRPFGPLIRKRLLCKILLCVALKMCSLAVFTDHRSIRHQAELNY